MKWIELTKKERKKLIDKAMDSIADDETSVNFYDAFKQKNPDIEITEQELYEEMVEE